MPKRCWWAEGDPLMERYHDTEWGVPERDSRRLWEKLILDGFQAGLSWLTVLRKRDAFREAFRGFEPEVVARFGARDVARLLKNAEIIRSRAKIEAAIGNARAYLKIEEDGETFSKFVWSRADGAPILLKGTAIPAKTPLSEALSKTLKTHGFKFVGPVIVYVWMQANGIVNDHVPGCFRRNEILKGTV